MQRFLFLFLVMQICHAKNSLYGNITVGPKKFWSMELRAYELVLELGNYECSLGKTVQLLGELLTTKSCNLLSITYKKKRKFCKLSTFFECLNMKKFWLCLMKLLWNMYFCRSLNYVVNMSHMHLFQKEFKFAVIWAYFRTFEELLEFQKWLPVVHISRI